MFKSKDNEEISEKLIAIKSSKFKGFIRLKASACTHLRLMLIVQQLCGLWSHKVN